MFFNVILREFPVNEENTEALNEELDDFENQNAELVYEEDEEDCLEKLHEFDLV